MALATKKDRPFRLLDLPAELQVNVYQKYLEDISITLEYRDDTSDDFQLTGMASLHLELVSRSMSTEARNARSHEIDRTLHVRAAGPRAICLSHFLQSARYTWLRAHITSIRCLGFRLYDRWNPWPCPTIDWVDLINKCPQLQHVYVTVPWNYRTIAYPYGLTDGYAPDSGYARIAQQIIDDTSAHTRIRPSPAGSLASRLGQVIDKTQRPGFRVMCRYRCTYVDRFGEDLFWVCYDQVHSNNGIQNKASFLPKNPIIRKWLRQLRRAGLIQAPIISHEEIPDGGEYAEDEGDDEQDDDSVDGEDEAGDDEDEDKDEGEDEDKDEDYGQHEDYPSKDANNENTNTEDADNEEAGKGTRH